MKTRNILASVVVAGILFGGFAFANTTEVELSAPSEKVAMMIKKANLAIVDIDYVKNVIGKGTADSAKAVLVDARPELKYKKGTIPSSINIPDTDYDKYISQLKDTPKDKEIIVFCGGWNCGKSPKVASMLKKDGFTNVKLYQAGEPEWNKKSYAEVDTIVIKSAQAKNSAMMIDARPYVKFLQETIAGSISIPDTEMEKYLGRFPNNKKEKIIVFCGGFKCVKSHVVANKLIDLGYTDVSVYAGGVPQWKKEGLPTTSSKSSAKNETKKVKKEYSQRGLKLSTDEGAVDGEWFNKLIKEDKVPSYVQIINVTSPEEFAKGNLRGSINIEAGKISPKELWDKLPKDKTVVFNCTAGGRSIEAWSKLKDANFDVSEIYYFDANIDCKGNNCKIEVNEPLE